MPGKTITGFGLRDLAIASRPTAAGVTNTWLDMPAIESAAFKLDVGEAEQWGDDVYLGTFYHSQKGKITAKGTKLSLTVLEALSGNAVTSSAGKQRILFGTNKELTPPKVVVRAVVPIRNEDGTAGYMRAYWYNTDVRTVWDGIPGNERAKIMEVSFEFNCYSSDQNEVGNNLGLDDDDLQITAFGHIEVDA